MAHPPASTSPAGDDRCAPPHVVALLLTEAQEPREHSIWAALQPRCSWLCRLGSATDLWIALSLRVVFKVLITTCGLCEVLSKFSFLSSFFHINKDDFPGPWETKSPAEAALAAGKEFGFTGIFIMVCMCVHTNDGRCRCEQVHTYVCMCLQEARGQPRLSVLRMLAYTML